MLETSPSVGSHRNINALPNILDFQYLGDWIFGQRFNAKNEVTIDKTAKVSCSALYDIVFTMKTPSTTPSNT